MMSLGDFDDGNLARRLKKIPGVLYGRLPLMVRLALREQVFLTFMLANRTRIPERFVVGPTRKL
ncbi:MULTISPECIES: hypothetical protein [unclassified Janthinobacterium]|uniref:hypothetical protein n=1 Tax=unclassified Janthinobacterium TaxID=2610881 RepID=UPI000365ABB4|nr:MULTISPECIES: hypothetical protein [unclassified Janthinobacterium]MEC5162772.1 hypothetical protein [Janthinobacterium sp. CG_S6]